MRYFQKSSNKWGKSLDFGNWIEYCWIMNKVIILAKVTNDGIRFTGKDIRPDGVNWIPETTSCAKPVALVWSRDMSRIDDAHAFAKKEGYSVFIMEDTEDVLNLARNKILTSDTNKNWHYFGDQLLFNPWNHSSYSRLIISPIPFSMAIVGIIKWLQRKKKRINLNFWRGRRRFVMTWIVGINKCWQSTLNKIDLDHVKSLK